MGGLKKSNINLNRKMLAEIAINDTATFTKLCEMVKVAA
jgi:large subunit ribosomal protein L20